VANYLISLLLLFKSCDNQVVCWQPKKPIEEVMSKVGDG